MNTSADGMRSAASVQIISRIIARNAAFAQEREQKNGSHSLTELKNFHF
jgi:hypothetical protein